eukprot:6184654-Pleurochrysis_carterae.AAC.1
MHTRLKRTRTWQRRARACERKRTWTQPSRLITHAHSHPLPITHQRALWKRSRQRALINALACVYARAATDLVSLRLKRAHTGSQSITHARDSRSIFPLLAHLRTNLSTRTSARRPSCCALSIPLAPSRALVR